MSQKAKQTAPACPCATIGGWDIREFQFPRGTVEAFELHHALDGTWECIHRCPTCGQLWHQSVTGGHMMVEVFNMVDAKQAAKLIHQNKEAAPLRRAEHEATLARLDQQLEAMSKPAAADHPVLQWAVMISFGIGTLLVLPGMMMGEGPEQMRLVFAGGGLFLIGMGCAAWAALRRR